MRDERRELRRTTAPYDSERMGSGGTILFLVDDDGDDGNGDDDDDDNIVVVFGGGKPLPLLLKLQLKLVKSFNIFTKPFISESVLP